ncbi:hypothetical protein RclHR1_01960013 [Rhizophagus clarus]|nr:hypothetical protein RclHR1_01960013 [Rhizophagus clarus]
MTMRSAGHQTIDNFFADLRKCWIERQAGPNLFSQSVTIGNQIQPQVINSQGVTSIKIEKLNSKIASLEAQLAESMQVHSKLAQRLQLLENVVNSNNTSIFDSHINQELEKRLGVIEINLAKLNKLIRKDIIDTKSTQCSEFLDYNNEGLEKRLERIEANLAKFVRKDTRGAKTPQRQCSKSLPFGGLEKKLKKIKALLNKLTKDSKSKSSRVHIATADKQSNSIFSDNDTSKSEDNDYNSDHSSAGSDSEKHDTHSKVSNKSELCKVKQNNNSSSAHNASLDKDSHGTKQVSLEETIRKIIQIEFENYLLYIIQQAKKCIPALTQDSDEEDILDGPMEINFIQKKDPATDVITVKCKIKRLVIPVSTVDPSANFLIMSKDIFKQLKLVIDTKEKYDLRGIATTPTESLGIVRNIPVNFTPGCTIYANFAVVKYPKLMLILPNTLRDKYNYDLLVKNKLEVNCARTTPECDASSTPDCILQDLIEDGTLKKSEL